jgi:hypothetical protein
MELQPIMFWTDDIRLRVHTATEQRFVGRDVTLREFAGEEPVALYETSDGDLIAYRGGPMTAHRPFVQGLQL